MKTNVNIFVLIPARNESKTLPNLLHNIKTNITKNIVVVDNNSTDNTFIIAKRYTHHVVREQKAGYGNACLAGIKYINNLDIKPSYICFFDGDGQSRVSDIKKVVAVVLYSNAIRYCQGTRMVHGQSKRNLTGSAFVANKVFAFILSKIWRQKMTDLGPLRCISIDLLNNIRMTSQTYAWTIEMNTKLVKIQEPIYEIPVHYQIRKYGKSKISGNFKTALKAAFIMSLVFMKTALIWRKDYD